MNETIVAKGLAKHLTDKFDAIEDDIRVMNKAETKEHGYTQGCATILAEGLPQDKYDAPWTYDLDGELLEFVQNKYGKEYWLEAHSNWMLCVWKEKQTKTIGVEFGGRVHYFDREQECLHREGDIGNVLTGYCVNESIVDFYN
jgi:hypothetical protein